MKGLRCITSTKRKKGQDSITDEIPICGFLNVTKIYKKKNNNNHKLCKINNCK